MEQPKKTEGKEVEFAFGKKNYKFLFIAIAIITFGYILMIGGGSDNPNVFSEKLFSATKITIPSIIVLIGYVVGIYAIMTREEK